ncbi:hypothetical protein M8J75_009495 [Diaphorina citri]|nr:hypothetical protein M8J75_009495 [Diaphorina citri]KAI5742166.1 hypothetical protein M8J77_003989 [Diaphorina citri]
MSNTNAKIDLLLTNLENLESQFNTLKNSNTTQVNANMTSFESMFFSFKALVMCELTSIKEQLSKQDERLNNLEQYSRRNCLLIHGVAEVGAGSEREDDCVASAVSIFKEKLKIDVLPFHIDRAHRIGKKDSGKNRAIIVKFVSYAQRRLVFSVKKLLKGSGIHITESLTKMNYQILDEAKKIYYKENVWTYDGRIIVKDRLDRKHTVVSMEDLKSLTVKTLANSAAFTPTAPSTSSRSNSSQIPKPKPVNNVPSKRGKAKK